MATRGIDFARLSLKDALDLAIFIEEEAKERYEDFASQMETHHTPDSARFYRFMAGNEEKHRAELAERRGKLFPKDPVTVSRQMLFDVEAPDTDEARTFMTPRQALTVALRCEEKAWAFFDGALKAIKDAGVKELFTELRQEEVEHQDLVKAELAKLPADDKFRTEDFEDEPVSHD